MRRLVALLAIFSAVIAVRAGAATPALFHVGVAVRNVDPAQPQYLGGFGFGDPVGDVHDSLEVRAMAIANDAGDMVLFAIVDTQGWFAGNQEGPWGSRDARFEAARRIYAAGITSVSDQNIIISSTHSHAAPTIMGIWGTTDPEYLKHVYEQTVDALVDAATHLHDANLYAGMGDIATVTISAITQTDGYQGWRPEGDTPVLWARDPATGATIGVYANVPTHADIVNGVGLHKISSDHIGVERTKLDTDLGGTAVVAMGTLGRQESIVQTDGFAAADRAGGFIANEIERALAGARAVMSDTLISAQQYVLVPATNPALAALNAGNMAADAAGPGVGTHCIPGADICTIDRAILPPYSAAGAFGAWFSAFRIGDDIVYATEPGEAFPEVSTAIRNTMNAPDVRIIGMAQDQLGYYYPPESVPFTVVNDSDHHIYNASLLLGEINVAAQALNASTLGFTPNPGHETNQWDEVERSLHAGVQFFPVARESVSPTVAFQVYTSSSVIGNDTMGLLGPDASPGAVTWDFGDGAVATTNGNIVVTHTYGAPDMYTVTATVTGSDGFSSTWTQFVYIDPPLSASVSGSAGASATAGLSGGSGALLAAHWTFSDASTADGVTVAWPAGTSGSVRIVDGAGNTAVANF